MEVYLISTIVYFTCFQVETQQPVFPTSRFDLHRIYALPSHDDAVDHMVQIRHDAINACLLFPQVEFSSFNVKEPNENIDKSD